MVVDVDAAYQEANQKLESNPKNAGTRRLSREVKNIDAAKL